jgi:hypothetical protein
MKTSDASGIYRPTSAAPSDIVSTAGCGDPFSVTSGAVPIFGGHNSQLTAGAAPALSGPYQPQTAFGQQI